MTTRLETQDALQDLRHANHQMLEMIDRLEEGLHQNRLVATGLVNALYRASETLQSARWHLGAAETKNDEAHREIDAQEAAQAQMLITQRLQEASLKLVRDE